MKIYVKIVNIVLASNLNMQLDNVGSKLNVDEALKTLKKSIKFNDVIKESRSVDEKE